jgi:hypothetical protein
MDRRAVSRRVFLEAAAVAGAGIAAAGLSAQSLGAGSESRITKDRESLTQTGDSPMSRDVSVTDEIVKEKIRRALLSGPDSVTREATVAEMDPQGKMVVLRPGTNQWLCVPGNENIIGQADMSLDPMGLRWMLDIMAGKPKPSNPTPGLIYMLNGATQRSYTDPFDRTSPAIPIGPHWMILWPFDPNAAGLPTCGSPWDGNEYHPGDRGVWKMTYERP